MKKQLLLPLFVALLVALPACKKNDEPKADLLGFWNVMERTRITTTTGASPVTSKTTYSEGQFTLDFKANGDLVVNGNATDPEPWKRISETRIEIDGLEYDIRQLTASQLVLFSTQPVSGSVREETFVCER
ncbi:hypothetical protein QNI19_32180 [Cytophagaceae bacterium DM2B3-1]|uniref:Lipocalin-like domain-containing protein n=1 Tax=Xanthocytophaga flava TaxID=3048013 RepID=A0ABT7CV61_9BACT|nr:hypothetical protein [Xanthocytophaga flavus]MDJ1497642.1 hypothetical protein [Xanthocytophaga flavus]